MRVWSSWPIDTVSGRVSRSGCNGRISIGSAGLIHCRRVKNGTNTDHPLTGRELRALRKLKNEQKPPSCYVFMAERGSPFTPDGFYKLMIRLGEKAKIETSAGPHRLRHSSSISATAVTRWRLCGEVTEPRGPACCRSQAQWGCNQGDSWLKFTGLSVNMRCPRPAGSDPSRSPHVRGARAAADARKK